MQEAGARDGSHEAAKEASSDRSSEPAEAAPDVSSEATADAMPDRLPEAAGDVAPEAEASADAPTEARPDAPLEAAPDASDAAVDTLQDASSCTDHLKNGDETDVDCGGSACGPCDDALGCSVDHDCKSKRCGEDDKCAVASCSDGVQNGNETDVDCGGGCTTKCELGKACGASGDCKSGLCPQGVCVECVEPTTCPGTDTECQKRTCDAGRCGVGNVAANTRLAAQTPGDCKANVCDGNGATTTANDDTDVPVDNRECTDDVCSNGAPSNPPKSADTSCTQGGGKVCDGAGACVACNAAAQCGQDTECKTFTCNAHVCGSTNAGTDKVLSTQIPGDCKEAHCDGSGGVTNVVNNTDVPFDGLECTLDLCTDGMPSNPAAPTGTTCSAGVCNGTVCGECNVAANCQGTDDACHHRTCDTNHCGFFNEPAGPAPTQTPGDCHVIQCDGTGHLTMEIDNTDVPNDNNDCTQDLCTDGVASNPAVAQGSHCAGGVCNDSTCVECIVADDCQGTDQTCHHRTCVSNHCGTFNEPVGPAPLTAQAAGDCHTIHCDGAGVATNDVDDNDVSDDKKDCTQDKCTNGTPSNPDAAIDTVCREAQGGRCVAAAVCVPTFMVVRVGDGGAGLSNASTAAFVERRHFDTVGALVSTIALPIAASGSNQILTLSGTTQREGFIQLSTNGQFATLLGYVTPPGATANVSSSTQANVKRVIGRIASNDSVDSSTILTPAYDANNSRGAVSVDGTVFWTAGASNSQGGI